MFSRLMCLFFMASSFWSVEANITSPSAYNFESLFTFRQTQQNDENLEKEAKKFIEEQKYEEAVSTYQTLLKSHPDKIDYLLKLGQLNLRLERRKEAIQHYEKILKIDPNNQEAEIALAYAYLFDKDLQKSGKLFEKLLKNSPNNSDILAGIGYLALLKDNESEAEKFFNDALKNDPKHTTSRIYMGNLRLRQHRVPEARKIFEELNAEDPNNPDVQQGLASVANAEKEILTRKATPDLKLTHPRSSTNQEIQLVKEATKLRDQKDYIKAAELYENLIKINPHNIEYLSTLGQLYLTLKRNRDAIPLYERALAINSERQDIRSSLAYSYLFENRLENSQRHFKIILENDPNNIEALAGLGSIFIRNKQFEDAENYLQKALQIDPENITTLLYLANLKSRQNRYSDAIEILNRALEYDPKRQDVKNALAFAYLFEKKSDISEELFRSILEKEPTNSEALAGMGRVAAIQNRFEEAERYYRKALETDPNNVTTLEFIALLKFQLKQYKEAEIFYSKLLNIDSQNKDYIEGLRNSRELPLIEKARELRKNKNYAESSAIMEHLVALSQDKVEYRLILGSIYMDMKRKDEAINLYYEGLRIKPNDIDLLRALGFIYLNKALEDISEGSCRWSYYFPFILLREKTNLYFSRDLFASVLEQNPQDADALAGMGRIALAQNCVAQAEYLYNKSLDIDPKNITTLSYLASLRSLQRKYFTADNTYLYLMQLAPDDDEIRQTYKNFLDIRRPFIDLLGYYAEENEKNPITEQWDARLKNYGWAITYVFPACDRLKLVANLSYDYIVLKDLINHNTIYSVYSPKPKIGFIWNQTPFLTISGGLSFAFYKQFYNSNFFTKNGQYYLPYLNALYIKNSVTCSIETIGDAPLVARDFATLRSDLIARQFINGFYEYDFGKRRLVGALASYAWYYNRIKNNQFQSGSVWLQATPSCFWENIAFRYVFIYGRFNDLTVDYYTFRPQVSHWIKIDLTKKWYDDRIITEAGYAHCWQRSFESGQIIQVTPVAVFHWVNREINAAYARLKVVFSDWMNAGITGTYSRDSFDYTTASVTGSLHIRF